LKVSEKLLGAEDGRPRGLTMEEELLLLFQTDEQEIDEDLLRFIIQGAEGHFGVGGSFGEIAVMQQWPSLITAFARTYVDVFTITRNDMYKVMALFPELGGIGEGGVGDAVEYNLLSRYYQLYRDFTFEVNGHSVEEANENRAMQNRIISDDEALAKPTQSTVGEAWPEGEAYIPRVYQSGSLAALADEYGNNKSEDLQEEMRDQKLRYGSGRKSLVGADGESLLEDDKVTAERKRREEDQIAPVRGRVTTPEDIADLEKKVNKLSSDMAKLTNMFESIVTAIGTRE